MSSFTKEEVAEKAALANRQRIFRFLLALALLNGIVFTYGVALIFSAIRVVSEGRSLGLEYLSLISIGVLVIFGLPRMIFRKEHRL